MAKRQQIVLRVDPAVKKASKAAAKAAGVSLNTWCEGRLAKATKKR
jgi:predicted HicB family RNase H-like nuclease